jgi:hypothetical protein
VYTIFASYLPSHVLSPHPPLPTGISPHPPRDLLYPPVLRFCKRKKESDILFKIATGSFLVTFPSLYVL